MKTTIAALALIAALAPPAYAITEEQEGMIKVCEGLGNAAVVAYAARDAGLSSPETLAYIMEGETNEIATELVAKVVDSVFELPDNETTEVSIYRVRAHLHHVATECYDTAIETMVAQ